MKRIIVNSLSKFALLYLLIVGLSACSSFMKQEDRALGYKITVIQGNELSQEQLDQLRVGMTKEEVQLLLGIPQLKNPFRNDTWYYVYTTIKADQLLRKNSLVLQFSGNMLMDISVSPEELNSLHI